MEKRRDATIPPRSRVSRIPSTTAVRAAPLPSARRAPSRAVQGAPGVRKPSTPSVKRAPSRTLSRAGSSSFGFRSERPRAPLEENAPAAPVLPKPRTPKQVSTFNEINDISLNAYLASNDDARKKVIETIRNIYRLGKCGLIFNTKHEGLFTEEAFASGAMGVIVKGSQKKVSFGVKISLPGLNKDEDGIFRTREWSEFEILREVNDMLFLGGPDKKIVSPHVVTLVGHVLCDVDSIMKTNIPELRRILNGKLNEMRKDNLTGNACIVGISEWVNGGPLNEIVYDEFEKLLKGQGDAEECYMKILSIVFQVCWTLSCLYAQNPHFRHNDLHAKNVLVHTYPTDPANLKDDVYSIGRKIVSSEDLEAIETRHGMKMEEKHRQKTFGAKTFRVPRLGVSARLWDFDYATTGPGSNVAVDYWEATAREKKNSDVVWKTQKFGTMLTAHDMADPAMAQWYAIDGYYPSRYDNLRGSVNHAGDFARFMRALFAEIEIALSFWRDHYPTTAPETLQAIEARLYRLSFNYETICKRATHGDTETKLQMPSWPSAWFLMMHTDFFDEFLQYSRPSMPVEHTYVHPEIDVVKLHAALGGTETTQR